MKCPKCEAVLPDESAFCNKCGTALGAKATPALPTPKPDEPEREVWRGSMSAWALFPQGILWALWAIGLSYLYFGVLGGKSPVLRYVYLVLVVGPFLYVVYQWVYGKVAVRYRMTTHRFFKTTGIFVRKFNELELVRVDDVTAHQNIVHRLVDVGNVTIISTDATDPRLQILGVKDPLDVKENIRSLVRKRRERSLYMETL